MRRSAWSLWGVGCLVAVLAFGACTDDAEPADPRGVALSPRGPETPRRGGSAVFGVLGEPPTLDPYAWKATDLTYALVRPIYPSLYRFDPRGRPVPYLAESLEPTSEGVRVHLAELRWSDGTPITSRDVAASVRRARAPSGFARVRGVRASGPRTVVLSGRVDDWEFALATAAFVLPDGRSARPGGRFGGPFVLAGQRPGLQVVYEPNPQWGDGAPNLERLKVQFVASVGFLLDLLERGDLDGAAVPSSVNLDDRLAARGIGHAEALGWESVYLDFRASGLGARERRALVGALDLGVLSEGIVRDDGRVARTLHPAPGPDGAGGPFADGGRGSISGVPVLLTGPGGDELIGLTTRIIQRQLNSAGAAAEIAPAEPSAVYGGGRGDPGGVKILRSAGVPGATDPRRAARSLDLYPLFHVESVVAFRGTLKAVEVNPSIEGPLWNAEQWWVGAP